MPVESLAGKFSALSTQSLKKTARRVATADQDEADFLLTPQNTSNASSSSLISKKDQDSRTLLSVLWPSLSSKPYGLTIKLVTGQMFRDICRQLKLQDKYGRNRGGSYSGTPFTARDMVRLRSKAYTTGAFDCNTGTMMNSSKGTLFHLDPKEITGSDQVEIEKFLLEDSAVLQKNGPVLGFISGGRRVRSKDSKPLRDFLVSIFHKGGVQHISQIWGQKYGFYTTDLITDAKNKTVYLLANDSRTLQDLMAHYERIHLAPGDVLETASGEKYTALDIVNGKPNTMDTLAG